MGASYKGNEGKVTRLLMEIDGRRVQNAREASVKKKLKEGGKCSRKLKSLTCSINYELDSAKSRGNNMERALLLSQ